MSKGKFTIEASFKALDKITAPVRAMERRIAAFGRSMDRISRGVDKVSAATARIGSGLRTATVASVAAGAAIGAVGYSLIRTGAEFEAALSNVAAVSGATGEQLKALSTRAQELGSSTKFTATEVVGAMEAMTKSGYTVEETLTGVRGVLAAAAADGGELADVSAGIMASMKGLGLGPEKMQLFADMLAKAGDATAAGIGTLTESMAKFGPVARQLNIPLESAVAQLALLQDAGLDASSAGTSLAAVYSKIAAPTGATTKAIQRLGLVTRDTLGNLLQPDELLANIRKVTEGIEGNAGKMEAVTQLVGLESQKALLNLAAAAGEGKLSSLTKELRDATGYAEKIAATKTDNFLGDLGRLGATVEGLKISLFETQNGPLRGVVQGITSWIGANKELIQTRVAEFIAEAVPTVKAFAAGVGAGVAEVRSFTVGIESAIGPLDQLFGASSGERVSNAHQLGKVVVYATAGFVGLVVVTKAASAAIIVYNVATKAVTATVWLFNAAVGAVRGAMLFYAIASKAGVAATVAMSFASKAATVDLIAQRAAALGAAGGMAKFAKLAGAGAAAAAAWGLAVSQNEELKKQTGGLGFFDIAGKMIKKGTIDPFEVVNEHQNKQARAAAAVREQSTLAMDRVGAGVTDFSDLTKSLEALDKTINARSLGSDLDVQRDPAAEHKQVPQVLSPSERAATRVERSVTEMKDKLEITIKDETGKAEVTEKPKRADVRRPQVGSSGSF